MVLQHDERRVLVFELQELFCFFDYVRKGLSITILCQLHKVRDFILLIFNTIDRFEVNRRILLHTNDRWLGPVHDLHLSCLATPSQPEPNLLFLWIISLFKHLNSDLFLGRQLLGRRLSPLDHEALAVVQLPHFLPLLISVYLLGLASDSTWVGSQGNGVIVVFVFVLVLVVLFFLHDLAEFGLRFGVYNLVGVYLVEVGGSLSLLLSRPL